MRENEPKMDTSVTADSPKPQGMPIQNGTPGKATGYGVANAPFEAIGIDSSDDSRSAWPPDQLAGQSPGYGKTTNSPNA